MSRLMCNCDFVITNVTVPATHEGLLITNVDIDKYDENRFRDESTLEDLPKRQTIECPQCKRIWIEKEPGSNTFVSYLPEAEALDLAVKQGGYRG